MNFIREQGVVGLAVGLAIGTAAGDTVKKKPCPGIYRPTRSAHDWLATRVAGCQLHGQRW